jgi:protein-S-isoprenylcysteine O-methyltransferase Ste14
MDELPTAGEIFSCLVIWTILFEWIGPRFIPGTTADPWDALAYGLGAIFAYWWWRRAKGRWSSVKPG